MIINIIYILTIIILLTFIFYYKNEIISYRRQGEVFANIISNLQESIKKEREDAIKQSKSVISGQTNENTISLFSNFPYNTQDIKFSGNPLDYLVFNGMTKLRDTNEGDIEIIFADVKTNTSSNTKIQNAIKKAIINNRVRFETWKVIDNKLIIK